jgi:hypothetical protein
MTAVQSTPARRRNRSAQLLSKLLASNWFTIDELAQALVVDTRAIGRYMSGEIDMPLERQICFAHFLIERVPPFARQGRNLLGQIKASIEFAKATTAVHRDPPMTRF